MTIRISGNEVLSIEDSDIFHLYHDLWLSKGERLASAYQGISKNDNMLKHRIGAGNASTDTEDEAVASVYGNRFCIPLDFELLESHMPFYQSALGDRLEYELTFNDYSNVIKSSDGAATYKISNISLEFDKVTERELARTIKTQFQNRFVILYDRILRQRKLTVNTSDPSWNINLNVPAKSMKGILMIFVDPNRHRSETFYNPKIEKVEITIEGVPNQLYSHGLRPYQQWDEICKYFTFSPKRDSVVGQVEKDLLLTNVNIGRFFTDKFALWLDLRSTDDNSLHGTGRRIDNASEGITLHISKKIEDPKILNLYLYTIQDAQLNFEDGRFLSAEY